MYSLLITLATWFQPEASGSSAPAATSAPKGGGPGGMDPGLTNIGFIALMAVAFYLLAIRPQQKKQKELETQLKALKKGQRVRTTGGVRGEIVDFKSEAGDEVVLMIADKVKINILRSSIASVIDAQAEAEKKS